MPEYNFGALPPLPAGYWVDYVECVEHYMAFGPDEWESGVTVDPYQARRWCFDRAARMKAMEESSDGM